MARRPRPAAPVPEAAEPPRIIGGDLRGRRLAHRPGGPTRPMKDRVRETLFDLLGTRVKGAVAIDLFAGTGALGFEAVSRGAVRGVFVERHFPTADVLRRSARELGLAERCEVLAGDALVWPRRMPDLPRDGRWIVFVSPPWQLFVDRPADLGELVATLIAAAPAESVVVVEADERFDPGLLPNAAAWESRSIAPAVLHFHGRLVS
ncbi:MAG: Ribosomal small subunit methyltransferase [Planctomycetota bacterium]